MAAHAETQREGFRSGDIGLEIGLEGEVASPDELPESLNRAD